MAKDSSTTLIKSNWANKDVAKRAKVAKDVPPKYQAKKKNRLPGGTNQHRVKLPLRCEQVLQDIYPNLSIPKAIQQFIIDNVFSKKEK